VAFLTTSMRADAGLMVSASHNTYEYNGIKLFGHDGFKLPDSVEAEIEKLVLGDELEQNLPIGEHLGRAKRIDDAMGRYIVHAKSSFPSDIDLKGTRIILDCAHGAAYRFAPLVFEELGAEVILIGNQPDGTNINRDCGALYPETMASFIEKYKADMGVALDGDADRVILADDKGHIVDGDQVMALIAIDMKEAGKLTHDTIVATAMSNMGLEIALKKHDITVEYADIGDRFVVDLMRKKGFVLGGEQSGHIINLNVGSTGDGVVAALNALSVVKRKGKALSELREVMKIFPQVLKNIRVNKKPPLDDIKEVAKAMKEARKKLGSDGRLLVRYSGTEPLCRVMIEGANGGLVHELAEGLEKTISKALE
jgi:phosphoglucosamine mutase